eukprot:362077-Chlamydomonas_euryale.AAC.20
MGGWVDMQAADAQAWTAPGNDYLDGMHTAGIHGIPACIHGIRSVYAAGIRPRLAWLRRDRVGAWGREARGGEKQDSAGHALQVEGHRGEGWRETEGRSRV